VFFIGRVMFFNEGNQIPLKQTYSAATMLLLLL